MKLSPAYAAVRMSYHTAIKCSYIYEECPDQSHIQSKVGLCIKLQCLNFLAPSPYI